MFRYIVYVLSLNNSKFGDYVNRIYLQELEIKDIPDTDRFVLYLDLHVDIDSEGWLKKLCDKRNDFNFPTVNILLRYSNISATSVYGVYISHLIRYFRV